MKRFSLAALLWIAISSALICAGCCPRQSATAPTANPSADETAKPTAEASDDVTSATDDTLFSLSEPVQQESDASDAAAPAKPEADDADASALTNPESDDADAAVAFPVKPEAAAPAVAPETILIKVNAKNITQGDLDKEIKAVQKIMMQKGWPDQQFAAMLPSLQPQILDGLLTQALIEEECTAKKIVVADADVKKEIENIKANLPKEVTLESILLRQGLTQGMLEEQIKDQLKAEKLLNVKVADKDVQQFYDDNKERLFETLRARHILIKVDPSDDAAAKALKKAKAEKLHKELAGGADFAKLAQENSDCPSKEFGGELKPPFHRGQMVKPFEDVAFKLKSNEISKVVETDFGYHIIQTLEIAVQPFDEVKGRIASILKGKETQQAAEPMIKSLKEKAKITYLNGATPPPPPEAMFQPVDEENEAPIVIEPEVTPEVKAESAPEAKPAVAEESIPEVKADAKPEVNTDADTKVKPDDKPSAKPDEKDGAIAEKPADKPKE